MEGKGAECHAAVLGHEFPISEKRKSQLFRTDTHVLFNSTKHGSFLPSKVCQLRIEKEEEIMSNHICPQTRRPEVFQPHFPQPIPSTAFQFSIKKSQSQEQWLKCCPLHSWRSAGNFRIQMCSFFILFSGPLNTEVWRRSESLWTGEIVRNSLFLWKCDSY